MNEVPVGDLVIGEVSFRVVIKDVSVDREAIDVWTFGSDMVQPVSGPVRTTITLDLIGDPNILLGAIDGGRKPTPAPEPAPIPEPVKRELQSVRPRARRRLRR